MQGISPLGSHFPRWLYCFWCTLIFEMSVMFALFFGKYIKKMKIVDCLLLWTISKKMTEFGEQPACSKQSTRLRAV